MFLRIGLKKLQLLALLALAPAVSFAQQGDKAGEEQPPPPPHLNIPPAPPLPPEDALKTLQVPPGFRVEIVAAEPLVQTPVAMQFDPDGNLWVLEMPGFMPNPDGEGENQPIGKIVKLEDKDGDGRMDTRTVFADGFVMARALSLVRGGVLVAEPPHLWFCRDTNGDGKADEKIEVANDYGNQANPEHNSNGLLWGRDNWIYSANHTTRYRNLNGTWESQPTIFRGQWGITQDDSGRLFYNSNSDQFRGDLFPPEYLSRNRNYPNAAGGNVQIAKDQSVWSSRINPGINRGYQQGMLRDGKLASFTAACGPVIYRGSQFPAEFYGNAFLCEPSANLIRRNVLTERDGILTATNAYDRAEFLTSSDERFRPVNLYNGPDGALYVVDMYRGILQHRIYLTTFLRRQILERGLDKPLDMGRIYRVVHENRKASPAPKLSKASSADLVKALAHPDGWWRDTAQRLLVERQDAAVVSDLRTVAKTHANPLARLHSLWVLDGQGQIDLPTIFSGLKDKDPKVRSAAIRLSESLLNQNRSLLSAVAGLATDEDTGVKLQVALTLGGSSDPLAVEALKTLVSNRADHLYLRDVIIAGLGGRELEFLTTLLENTSWLQQGPGRDRFVSSLAFSIANSRHGQTVGQLLDLAQAQKESAAWRQTAILEGVSSIIPPSAKGKPAPTVKPITLEKEPSLLAELAKAANPKLQGLRERLNLALVWPGKPDQQTQSVVALTPEEQALFDKGKEFYVTTCGACHQPHGNGQDGLAPPLAESEWVLGSDARLVRIALHGVRGAITVKGKQYELEMPGMGVLEDEQIAAVLTYIRREWGHTGKAISPAAIAKIRAETEKREEAWTEAELLKLP